MVESDATIISQGSHALNTRKYGTRKSIELMMIGSLIVLLSVIALL
jgi:hypothetical protein